MVELIVRQRLGLCLLLIPILTGLFWVLMTVVMALPDKPIREHILKCLSINSHDLVQDNHSGRQCVECNVREIRLLVSWYQFAKSVEP